MSLETTTVAAPTGQETAPAPEASNDLDARFDGILDIDAPEQETATPGEDTELTEGAEPGEEEIQEPNPFDGYEDFELEGKVYKIPSEIKDGYLRLADYTRKTQEVAETRKQFEAREQELNQRFQHTEEEFNAWLELTDVSNRLKSVENVDWNAEAAKLQDDPIAFQELQRAYMQWQQLTAKQQQLVAKTNEAAKNRTEAAQQETAKRLSATRDYAEKNIKGWTPELDAKITGFAISDLGYTPEILATGINPANYKTLHLAYLGHQSQLRQISAKSSLQAKPIAATQTVSAKANAAVAIDPEKSGMAAYIEARQAGKLK